MENFPNNKDIISVTNNISDITMAGLALLVMLANSLLYNIDVDLYTMIQRVLGSIQM